VAKPSLIRDIHQVSVLNLLRRHGATSRARLARELNLTRSTLTSLVNQLSGAGYVVETGRPVVWHATGRPGVAIELNPAGASFIGADIGYGVLHAVVLNLAADVVAHARAEFAPSRSPAAVLADLGSLVDDLVRRNGIDLARTKGLGVAVPGTTVEGRIVLSPGLGWRDVPVAAPLAAATGLPVLVENNANAAALAELYLTDHADVPTLVYVHLGTGIGSGIIVNGEIFGGSFGAAGEIGNIRLARDGPVDRKGNRGTFEAFASLPAVLAEFTRRGGQAADIAELLRAHRRGEAAAVETVDGWAGWLGQVVLMLLNVLNPARIVLGGPLAPLASVAMPRVVELVRREQLPGSDRVDIAVSDLGDDANALGGAMLVYHTVFGLPPLEGSTNLHA